jgi:hypothetical protein
MRIFDPWGIELHRAFEGLENLIHDRRLMFASQPVGRPGERSQA